MTWTADSDSSSKIVLRPTWAFDWLPTGRCQHSVKQHQCFVTLIKLVTTYIYCACRAEISDSSGSEQHSTYHFSICNLSLLQCTEISISSEGYQPLAERASRWDQPLAGLGRALSRFRDNSLESAWLHKRMDWPRLTTRDESWCGLSSSRSDQCSRSRVSWTFFVYTFHDT